MKKKSLIILSTLFIVLFIHTISFAEDMKQDFMNMTNSISQDATSGANMIKDNTETVESAIEDGAKDLGNDIENAAESTGNFIQNTGENIKNTYMASRTSTQDMENTGMNSYVPWIVIGVAFAVIIGLTWYYLSQTNTTND